MDSLHFALTVLAAWTDEMGKDIWHWVLANFNLVAIVGAFRMWSMSEHRKTAKALEAQRAELAEQLATMAKRVADQSHGENVVLAAAIQENTAISTRAFHEANSVNQKIAAIGAEQNVLATQQNAMQDERDRDKT